MPSWLTRTTVPPLSTAGKREEEVQEDSSVRSSLGQREPNRKQAWPLPTPS